MLSHSRKSALQPIRLCGEELFADASGALRMGYRYDDDSKVGELLYRPAGHQSFDVIEKSKTVDDNLAIPEALAPDGSAIVLDNSSGRSAVYQTAVPALPLGKQLYASPKYDVDDVILDAAGYRERRRETLESRADRAADQALSSNNIVEMDPMSAQERRVVHERLKERAGVETYSEGDEPHRCVVVAPLVTE